MTNFSINNYVFANFNSHDIKIKRKLYKNFELTEVDKLYNLLKENPDFKLLSLDNSFNLVEVEKVDAINYRDKIYDVTVPNYIILVKRDPDYLDKNLSCITSSATSGLICPLATSISIKPPACLYNSSIFEKYSLSVKPFSIDFANSSLRDFISCANISANSSICSPNDSWKGGYLKINNCNKPIDEICEGRDEIYRVDQSFLRFLKSTQSKSSFSANFDNLLSIENTSVDNPDNQAIITVSKSGELMIPSHLNSNTSIAIPISPHATIRSNKSNLSFTHSPSNLLNISPTITPETTPIIVLVPNECLSTRLRNSAIAITTITPTMKGMFSFDTMDNNCFEYLNTSESKLMKIEDMEDMYSKLNNNNVLILIDENFHPVILIEKDLDHLPFNCNIFSATSGSTKPLALKYINNQPNPPYNFLTSAKYSLSSVNPFAADIFANSSKSFASDFKTSANSPIISQNKVDGFALNSFGKGIWSSNLNVKEAWSNITKIINKTGKKAFKFYASDLAGNWNETEVKTIEIDELGISENLTVPNISEAILNVSVKSPSKITRGEVVAVRATITNTGSAEAKNVLLTWKLPEGFEIISSDQTQSCGILEPNASCTSVIAVQSSLSAELGKNEIKVVVSYE
jgi:uncharacterized repeat protein (TIGR01451 family)